MTDKIRKMEVKFRTQTFKSKFLSQSEVFIDKIPIGNSKKLEQILGPALKHNLAVALVWRSKKFSSFF